MRPPGRGHQVRILRSYLGIYVDMEVTMKVEREVDLPLSYRGIDTLIMTSSLSMLQDLGDQINKVPGKWS